MQIANRNLQVWMLSEIHTLFNFQRLRLQLACHMQRFVSLVAAQIVQYINMNFYLSMSINIQMNLQFTVLRGCGVKYCARKGFGDLSD